MPVSSATSEISFNAMRRMQFYLMSTVGDGRMFNLYTQTCASRLGYDSWGHFINLYKWKTMNNSWRINVQRVTSIRHVFCYSFRH
jgi:hypothetical protein